MAGARQWRCTCRIGRKWWSFLRGILGAGRRSSGGRNVSRTRRWRPSGRSQDHCLRHWQRRGKTGRHCEPFGMICGFRVMSCVKYVLSVMGFYLFLFVQWPMFLVNGRTGFTKETMYSELCKNVLDLPSCNLSSANINDKLLLSCRDSQVCIPPPLKTPMGQGRHRESQSSNRHPGGRVISEVAATETRVSGCGGK
jgi:hypothetical protein